MQQLYKILRTMCRRSGTPLSTRVSEMASKGQWLELQGLSVEPSAYADPFSYWKDAMCVDLVRKVAFKGSNTAQAAVDKFLETERVCRGVNQQMRTIRRNHSLTMSDMAFADRLDRWKEKIRCVLGKVPEYLEPSFSGGSTTSTMRMESTIFDKLSMTPELYSHSPEIVNHLFYSSRWGDVSHQRGIYPRVAVGNEYFTVPKNGLTDRSCCKEAVINLAYQLAVGKVLRKRALERLNIDLDHGASHHRALACEGSLYGNWVTLDLSSASDRWARELVRYLLGDWAILLDSLRATHTTFGGKRLYLEKYSSMGNGFTFELESILFATLAHVVQDELGIVDEVYCYGDDLIVRPEVGIPLAGALAQVGHQLNMKKSFLEGPFRESCGGDYHSGVAVNTVKLEKLPEEPSDWISFANNLKRVSAKDERYWAFVKPVWDLVLSQIPNQIRSCRGPKHLGDTVIHDSPQWWGWHRDGRHLVRVYKPVIARRDLSYYTGLPTALILGMVKSVHSGGFVDLPKVEGYRLAYVDPTDGSNWLPSEVFRKVDPRFTRLHQAVGHRLLS